MKLIWLQFNSRSSKNSECPFCTLRRSSSANFALVLAKPPQEFRYLADDLPRDLLVYSRGHISPQCHYALLGSTIQITYEAKGEDLYFNISNPAPDMGSDDVEQVFEPFWRMEGQRPDQDRAGLGLALCEGFAEILGHEIEAALLPEQIFEVTLRACP